MDIHVITLWWLGYPWYIYVINCISIPEGSWSESDDLASWRDSIWRSLCLCTTRTPIQGIRMFVTSNRFCRWPRAFSGCRWARIHSTSSGLSCQGTQVRLACSRQSTQLAWLAGTGAQGGTSDVHTPAIHCQQALSVRSPLWRDSSGEVKIWKVLLQNVTTLVCVQVIGYMWTGREFKRTVWSGLNM